MIYRKDKMGQTGKIHCSTYLYIIVKRYEKTDVSCLLYSLMLFFSTAFSNETVHPIISFLQGVKILSCLDR